MIWLNSDKSHCCFLVLELWVHNSQLFCGIIILFHITVEVVIGVSGSYDVFEKRLI